MRKLLVLLCGIFIIAGCSNGQFLQGFGQSRQTQSVIDWVDSIQWNDSDYVNNYEVNQLKEEWPVGTELGEVTFKMDGHAGANYQLKNGDAAYLDVGTKLYEMEGYDPAFRIVADGKVYEVSHPENAETIGDFLDIDGKVERIVLQSTYDLSIVGEFSQERIDEFVDELLALPYDPAVFDERGSGPRVFFGMELEDGTMTRTVYYPESRVINYGAVVSDRLAEILEQETADYDY